MYICNNIATPKKVLRGSYTKSADLWSVGIVALHTYAQSPLEDSRLFGPSPWKILATTYEQMDS